MRQGQFRLILILATTSASLVQHPASAQGVAGLTAENLRDACDSLVLAVRGVQPISQEDPGAMLCLGYLAGWNQAMELVPDRPYCLPPAATIQPGDLADLLVAYIDNHPERRSALAHDALMETFTDAFPCEDDGDQGTEVDPE